MVFVEPLHKGLSGWIFFLHHYHVEWNLVKSSITMFLSIADQPTKWLTNFNRPLRAIGRHVKKKVKFGNDLPKNFQYLSTYTHTRIHTHATPQSRTHTHTRVHTHTHTHTRWHIRTRTHKHKLEVGCILVGLILGNWLHHVKCVEVFGVVDNQTFSSVWEIL